MVRPYLFLIISGAFLFESVFSRQKAKNIIVKLIVLVLLFGVFLSVGSYIAHFGGFTDYSVDAITQRAVQLQNYGTVGTHISASANLSNTHMLWVFLPVSMAANLFLPLFVYANNVMAYLASIQNLFLIVLIYFFFKKRGCWNNLKQMVPMCKYMFWFFIIGMTYLAMINTNLGLADREKIMYLPVFLISMFVTFVFSKYSSEKSMV